MSAFDASSNVVEEDFPAAKPTSKPRSIERAELDSQVVGLQNRITELTSELSNVETERVQVEESRRRLSEFEMGRGELLSELTRSLGLLGESEQSSRREAEQLSRSIGDLREALGKVESLVDIDSRRDEWKLELTRGLTTLENARMELNAARIKWPQIHNPEPPAATSLADVPLMANPLVPQSFGQLCVIGLAVTWPLLLLGLAVFLYLITR